LQANGRPSPLVASMLRSRRLRFAGPAKTHHSAPFDREARSQSRDGSVPFLVCRYAASSAEAREAQSRTERPPAAAQSSAGDLGIEGNPQKGRQQIRLLQDGSEHGLDLGRAIGTGGRARSAGSMVTREAAATLAAMWDSISIATAPVWAYSNCFRSGSAATSSIPRMAACTALGSRSRRDRLRAGSVGKNRRPVMTPVATTQSPGARPGASPPATPKLMIPQPPRATADSRAAARRWPWLQTANTPAPAATRASITNEETAAMPPDMKSAHPQP